MSNKLLSASAFAIAISMAVVPAFADVTITEQRSVTVRYSDLDISTSPGAHELLARITRAAEMACDSHFTTDLVGASATKACINDAIDRAVAEVGSPLVAEARGTTLAGSSVARN
ncbi:MAG: UrcA family protein [Alphaproteobacteria bacterium]